jgi:tellurite resistance protein TehA-like permease
MVEVSPRDEEEADQQASFWQVAQRRLEALPLSICGIALGSVGLGSALRNVGRLFSINYLDAASIPFFLLSACFVVIVLIRIASSSWTTLTKQEFKSPLALAAYGALSLTMGFLSEALVKTLSQEQGDVAWWIGAVGIYVAGVFQFVNMLAFFRACFDTKSPPEPLWFPPTVGMAMTGWTGTTVNMPRVLVELSFWGGVAVTVVLLPIVIWRTLRFPSTVAPNPTVGILQAPASFVAIAWFAIGGSEWWWHNDVLVIILFATSTAAFLLTVVAIIQRYSQLRTQGITHAWASFTFPSVSTTTAALLMSERYPSSQLLFGWAATLSLLLLPFVFIIIVWYTFQTIFHPRRLYGPPKKPTGATEECSSGGEAEEDRSTGRMSE